MLAQRRGLRIHEVPVDWIDDPDSRVDIVRTAAADLRGIARLLAASPFARFAGIGVLSTLSYALLYLLLRSPLGAGAANALVLAVTAVGNTAANRRFTFGVRGRAGLLRQSVLGTGVYLLTLALTSGALSCCTGLDARPGARGRAHRPDRRRAPRRPSPASSRSRPGSSPGRQRVPDPVPTGPRSSAPAADPTRRPPMTTTALPRGASALPAVRRLRLDPLLLAVLALAGVLTLWGLTRSGYSNEYYAAAARAGSESWTAWFFGSLDPGSFITVDKPPLSLWLMGLSARVLGFSSFSILLPQALCTIAAVALLFATVKRAVRPPGRAARRGTAGRSRP